MAWPIVKVTNGGIAVTESTNGFGTPYDEATNGFGTAVTFVSQGGIPVLARGGKVYDTDAAAIMAVSPQSNEMKDLINNTVVALKDVNRWNEFDVLWITAADDTTVARVNWKNPSTYMLLPVNSPTFEVRRGYQSDGAASRLRTQYNPAVNGVKYTLTDACLGVWISAEGAVDGGYIAGNFNAPATSLSPRNSTNQSAVRINDSSGASVSVVTSVKGRMFSVTRKPDGNRRLIRDTATVGTYAIAPTSIPNTEFWLCGSNPNNYNTLQVGAAWAGSSLIAEAATYNALLPYMQAIGVN